MAKSRASTISEIRDPYSILTDNGETVNTRTANPNQTIKIHGHKLKIRDIPITAAQLNCGHNVRGIAFAAGNLVYCDKHGDGNTVPATVVEVL